MRVLMLAQFYPPTAGGEERHVQSLSAELAARGHDVAVATLWHEGLLDFEVDGGVEIYRLRGSMQRLSGLFSESGRRHAPPFPDPELVAGLRRVVARVRPDIVHAHNWLLHSFLPLKTWSGAKLVLTLHDYSLICAQKRLMYRDREVCSGPGWAKCIGCGVQHYGPMKGVTTVLGNWAMGRVAREAVDMFLPVSEAVVAQTALVRYGLPYRVLPNFVPDDFGALTAVSDDYTAQLPADGYLLFVGDVTRDKGVDVLLRAYSGLNAPPPLVLIGRRAPDFSLDVPPGVILLGMWPHDAIMHSWRRSSIAILASIVPETFGIVVIEAMSCARPVIASHIGGLPDVVVDGQTGILVPPGDVAALRSALQGLLDDPDRRVLFGDAGARRVAEFRASAVVPRIEAVYRGLLRGTSRRVTSAEPRAPDEAFRDSPTRR